MRRRSTCAWRWNSIASVPARSTATSARPGCGRVRRCVPKIRRVSAPVPVNCARPSRSSTMPTRCVARAWPDISSRSPRGSMRRWRRVRRISWKKPGRCTGSRSRRRMAPWSNRHARRSSGCCRNSGRCISGSVRCARPWSSPGNGVTRCSRGRWPPVATPRARTGPCRVMRRWPCSGTARPGRRGTATTVAVAAGCWSTRPPWPRSTRRSMWRVTRDTPDTTRSSSCSASTSGCRSRNGSCCCGRQRRCCVRAPRSTAWDWRSRRRRGSPWSVTCWRRWPALRAPPSSAITRPARTCG
jgi:hypothetical protein